MIVPKNQKKPKLKKVVVVAPQASAVNSALPKVRDVKTAAVPYASAVRSAAAPEACAHSQIQDRAFAIFEKRGSRHGDDLQDWLRAERQVMAH
jgi:Protein of unknown function (DUF2934)